MKKLLAFFIALLSCVAFFAFTGCEKENDPDALPDNTDENNVDGGEDNVDGAEVSYVIKTELDGNKSVVFTASKDVLTIGYSTSVADYLNALKAKNYLAFESQTGEWGLFITSMDGTANVDNPDFTGYSWMFYIDFLTLEGDEAIYGSDYSTVTYEGKTLYSSNNGVSGTPCVEGHTYAFVYEAYDYSSWN